MPHLSMSQSPKITASAVSYAGHFRHTFPLFELNISTGNLCF